MCKIKKLLIFTALLFASLSCNLHSEEILLLQQLQEARKKAQITLNLHEEHNEKGELTHLGIALFNKQHQEVLNPFLWRGAERMLLELLVKDNDKERIQWLKERNVRLFYEATPFGNQGFASFSKIMPILNDVQAIKIIEDADRYRLIVTGGPEESNLRLSFPKERELIYGTDKKEEDQRQCIRLQSFQGAKLPIFLPSQDELLLSNTPDVYHTAGQALYIDSLRTDGYYKVENGDITPVYSSVYPKMSVRNLLLGKLRRPELNVHIMHRQYGNQVVEWTTSWDNLLAALCSEEVVEPYAAVHYVSKDKPMTGILILRNIAFGYNNMLLLSINCNQLDSDQPATLECSLYTNIPQHNILSLFEERTHGQGSANSPKQKFNHPIKK